MSQGKFAPPPLRGGEGKGSDVVTTARDKGGFFSLQVEGVASRGVRSLMDIYI